MSEKPTATKQILKALIENSFDLLALIDETGKYIYVSESVFDRLSFTTDVLLGYAAKELIGTNCFNYMHPDDLPWLKKQFSLLFTGEKKIYVPPYRFRNANGDWRWIEAVVTNQLDNPDIKAIVVSARDISNQIETENKLKELQLLEALREGEERERNRIAKELHDSVASMLAAVKMHFTSLQQSFSNPHDHHVFNQALNLLEEAYDEVRKTAHSLMPEFLLQHRLNEALAKYCAKLNQTNSVRFEYDSIGNITRLPLAMELSVYRIVQELLHNVIKHANATTVFVQLSMQERVLAVTVEDNGVGFDLKKETSGLGLLSLRNRVHALGGNIDWNTTTGNGTSVHITIDMNNHTN